jgi:hypothetical protein
MDIKTIVKKITLVNSAVFCRIFLRPFPVSVLLFTLFSCASIIPETNAVTSIPKDIAGMVHASGNDSAIHNQRLDELGVVWLRTALMWKNIEREKGVWDFSYYDWVIENNITYGRKTMAVLGDEPSWIHSNGKTHDYISPGELPLYLEYVERTVLRYKDKVDAWELWNEPNINFRFWRGPDADFFTFAKAVAEKVRECDPNAKIIGGSFFRAPAQYIKKMFAMGAFDTVDALAFHPYASTPRGTAWVYDKFVKILKEENFKGEIWITEVGYPTGGIYPSRVSEKRLGKYIRDTFTALASRGARVIFWYHLQDSFTRKNKPLSLDSEHFFGLVYSDYEKKGGAGDFGEIVRELSAK